MSAAARRAQLLRLARDMFAERGFDAASMEDLAQRADVSKPVVYGHFHNKPELYQAVLTREVEHLLGSMQAGFEQPGGSLPALEALLWGFFTYVEEHPSGFRLLSLDNPVSERNTREHSSFAHIDEEIQAAILPGLVLAGIDPKFGSLYTQIVIGLAVYTGVWWLEHPDVPKHEVCGHVSALLWDGAARLTDAPTLQTIDPS